VPDLSLSLLHSRAPVLPQVYIKEYKFHLLCNVTGREGDYFVDNPEDHLILGPALWRTVSGWTVHRAVHRATGREVCVCRARLDHIEQEEMQEYLKSMKQLYQCIQHPSICSYYSAWMNKVPIRSDGCYRFAGCGWLVGWVAG
jgi:hypothetical protein